MEDCPILAPFTARINFNKISPWKIILIDYSITDTERELHITSDRTHQYFQ